MMEKMMQTPKSRQANSRNSIHWDKKYWLVYELYWAEKDSASLLRSAALFEEQNKMHVTFYDKRFYVRLIKRCFIEFNATFKLDVMIEAIQGLQSWELRPLAWSSETNRLWFSQLWRMTCRKLSFNYSHYFQSNHIIHSNWIWKKTHLLMF